MDNTVILKSVRILLTVASTSLLVQPAVAQLYINEIFVDPPGSETQREYVELRGNTPGMSLDNYWLIVLENEGNLEPDMSEVGSVDSAIDLSGLTLGSNGFLVMRRTGNPYAVDPGATDVALPSTLFENSGGTFMLINKGTGPTPTTGMALDGNVDNDEDESTKFDGLDYPNAGQPGWTIVDSIGVSAEPGEVGLGRMYGSVNFGPEPDGFVFTPDLGGGFHAADHLEPGAVYSSTGFENELIARYGNSTGQTARDWHVTNVTDNGLAGYTLGNFVQAGTDPHGFPREPFSPAQYSGTPTCDYACYVANYHESESSQFVPYGTAITSTLGSANYPLNQAQLPWDFNGDGVVDAADYTVWRDTLGQGDSDPKNNPLAANVNRNATVDPKDYEIWKFHFGESLPPGTGTAAFGRSAVPEPTTLFLVSCAGIMLVGVRQVSRR